MLQPTKEKAPHLKWGRRALLKVKISCDLQNCLKLYLEGVPVQREVSTTYQIYFGVLLCVKCPFLKMHQACKLSRSAYLFHLLNEIQFEAININALR